MKTLLVGLSSMLDTAKNKSDKPVDKILIII